MNKLRVGIAGYGIVGKRRRTCVDHHPHMQVVTGHLMEKANFRTASVSIKIINACSMKI